MDPSILVVPLCVQAIELGMNVIKRHCGMNEQWYVGTLLDLYIRYVINAQMNAATELYTVWEYWMYDSRLPNADVTELERHVACDQSLCHLSSSWNVHIFSTVL